MDTKSLTASDYVSKESIKNSPSKKATIVSTGIMPTNDGEKKFTLMVDMDGEVKRYIPNKTTLKNIQKAHGFESQDWVGKSIRFEAGVINSKEATIGVPV